MHISIAETIPRPTNHNVPRLPTPQNLRQQAFWYPAIPPPHLHLNEHSYTGEDPTLAGYRPLIWAHFGGHKGSHLQHLTCISVTQLGGLCGIKFKYNTNDVAAGDRTLGRRNFTDHSRVLDFPIDGPTQSGEIITAFEVSLEKSQDEYAYRFYKHGKLESLKV